MTKATSVIVTALSEGPATARDLSQRIDGVTYANIRQTLRRLASRGTVTESGRGLYGMEPDCDKAVRRPSERQRRARWRRSHGKTALMVYPDQDIIEDAIWAGLIPPEKVNDRHFI